MIIGNFGFSSRPMTNSSKINTRVNNRTDVAAVMMLVMVLDVKTWVEIGNNRLYRSSFLYNL